MLVDSTESLLFAYFGTRSPYWQLSADSNALQLAGVKGVPNLAVALQPQQANEIRAFTGVTSHAEIDITLFGEPQKLSLVGKKSGAYSWTGTASNYMDTSAVAKDLSQGLEFAEQVISEVNSLVVIIDHNFNILRFNRLCEEVTGLREKDVIGKSAHAFMVAGEREASRSNLNEFFRNSASYEAERAINTINGERRILWRNKFVQSGSGPDERYLVCSGTDVTEERKAQAKLLKLATIDTLTGLSNRHAIYEQIAEALTAGSRFGVLFLDLDNFKQVNDHYGHVIGDSLIQAVALNLEASMRDGDVVARTGGAAFLVLVREATVELMENVARRIIDRLRAPINLGLIEAYTSCSIGIALFPDHGDTLEQLVRCADTAMYVAKDAGKRTYRVFSPEMDNKVAEYIWLDVNLRKALEADGQLKLYYQPKLCVKTGEVHSVEALLRWDSPDRGRIPPLDFISYAEESGFIVPLGRWVMREAAKQAAAWKAQKLDIRIAINLSARQLTSSTLIQDFSDVIRQSGQSQCLLDIELTESCLIDDEISAHAIIRQFRELGAKVQLDDFGTGYSSLSQLARLPLDVIKLDQSFISSIDQNATSQTLVRAMIAVAKQLNLEVVAEGVEAEGEAEFLKDAGVDYFQGYLYGRPMPVKEFEEWLNNKGKRLRLVA
ncbi:cyclic di-GMP phosphodiesterase [Eoetvoesiella caeni]|uniref:Cyclic di-GMP phosphodiesterase Gmr n=1 Tax=Eoetvoesiella caeni TaxID=645616 RepID=A0A366H2V6_9BURK|nr:cyclic di-GMP phosphodiesterase [Eoetvoesiella caeni]MCI2810879.1 cyclic di-GMP phosphodiesterase [Eoetvoesiella caeni]NYT56822.1 cyclic di-GMP phosphodiesterase [Eoetvoesiella caeni]RBP35620.1 cyclic di-GMP phosphodiesterase Gmr [Eoetvoesiella caeni]